MMCRSGLPRPASVANRVTGKLGSGPRAIRIRVALATAAVLVGSPSGARAVGVVTGPDTACVGAAGQPAAKRACPQVRAVPGRLVVKYRHDVDACVHCLLAHRRRFARAGGHESLDALHTALGVTKARPLFFHRHGLGGDAAGAAFRAHIESIHRRFPRRAARARPVAEVPDLTHVYELEVSESIDIDAAAALYARDPAVVYAHPVYEVGVGFTPNDPSFATVGSWGQSYPDLWGLHTMNAAAAWDVSTGSGTVIGVVDSGVNRTHADLAANMWTNPGEVPGNRLDDDGNGYVDDVDGWNFDAGNGDTRDGHGHGTHVAGTAAAVGDNALGVLGVAWNARVMAVKGLNDDGNGFSSLLAEGIVYAAENGADVINNSWGGFGLAEEIYEAIEVADALGAVVVAAAGNDGREIAGLLWLPAAHPLALTVGAFDPDGALASFSNYGPHQSVTAPGVDVLSLGSRSTYVRFSGTSMATPHAAGLAAVVLAADPQLTPAEVRWRLELGAEQPGALGFEGARHNPIFGFGRLDAAKVFDVPPVTTRVTQPEVREWHAFAEPTPVPGRPARFLFTSLDPVAWSIETPAWMTAVASSGSGPATLDLEIDAAGLAPGAYTGDVSVSAPVAADGGGAFAARLHVHDDRRFGEQVRLGQDGAGGIFGFEPALESVVSSFLLAWRARAGGLSYAVVNGAGVVTGPRTATSGFVYDIAAGTDGHEIMIGWRRFSGNDMVVELARVRADGTLVDTIPIEVFRKRDGLCTSYTLAGIGHDGTDCWIGLVANNYCASRDTFYVIRVRSDGSFGPPARLYRTRTNTDALFDCAAGGCLFAWLDLRPEGIEAETGKYIRSGYALPVAGERVRSDPKRVVTDLQAFTDLATDGREYFALGQRVHYCGAGDLCRTEVIGVRIGGAGDTRDAGAIVISNVPPSERLYPWPGSVAFDGTDWVASYQVVAIDDGPFEEGSYLFVNRVATAGTSVAQEHVGWLVDSAGTASESKVAVTATHTVVAWEDRRSDTGHPVYPDPDFTEHRAQRLFPRPPGNEYPDRVIGSIGALTVGEGEFLRFRVVAPGQDPGATIYAASGLQAGAYFDSGTRLFQWRPDGDDAGSYPGVVFTAASGGSTVTETVSIDVTARVSTVSGVVRLGDGTPLGGAALKVRGTTDRTRTVYTDAAGRYRLEGGLAPGKTVVLGLTNPTRGSYRTDPGVARVVAGTGDLVAPDLIATPR